MTYSSAQIRRAVILAESVKEDETSYTVPSSSQATPYTISKQDMKCPCPYGSHGGACAHVLAIGIYKEKNARNPKNNE